uniref:Putative host-nuclease inhibitor protein n=1 Tax=viral metagenome TaxID=1070528 RepID=A0A6M3Y2R8_9ZZZZ
MEPESNSAINKIDDLDGEGNFEQGLLEYESPDLIPAPEVANDEAAEKQLRALRYWLGELDRAEQHAKNERDRIELWLEGRRNIYQPRIAWHERGLKAYLWNVGKKSLKLIAGTIKRTKGRERIDVLDQDTFIKWAAQNGAGLLRTKVEPDKKAIAGHIQETGEIPPGVDLVRGEDTFSVTIG